MNPDPDRPDPPSSPARRAARADLRLGLALLGAAALLGAWLIPTYVRSPMAPRPLAMAPWFLPGCVTALLGVASAALCTGAWRRGPGERADGPGSTAGSTAGSEAGPETGPPPTTDRRGLAVAFAALILWLVLMPLLGALPTAILVTLALTCFGAASRRPADLGLAVAVGVLGPAATWLAFVHLAGTPLPGS